MLLDSVIIVLGFVGLIWGADKFIYGASGLARNLGVSPLVIGLTIVAFGTSAPEIFSSAAAAWEGKPELAVGNALGSNLFNIGIAIGVAALIRPLQPPACLVNKELPALLLVTLATGILLMDLYLGPLDAMVLIGITLYLGYRLFRKRVESAADTDTDQQQDSKMNSFQAVAYLVLGLALLVLGAEALVEAASSIAESLGVSTAIIGLTIIALGTSLPELAAAISCVLKGHDDIAIGNVVGSNIFNLLVVLPFPGLLSAGDIEAEFFYRDFVGVLLLTVLLAYLCYRGIKRQQPMGRLSGILFLSIYGGWFTLMSFQISQSLTL